jgi:hypothetical protein
MLMNIAIPQWLALLLVGAGLVAILVALIVTIRAFVRSRSGEYYVIRDEARRTALRAVLVLVILILLTIAFLLIPRQSSTPEPTATVAPPQPSPSTPTRVVSTRTPIATSTPRPTATEPFIPTATPQATLPITLTRPLPSAVPPPGDARFEFWTLAQSVDENNQPVELTTDFPVGIERVYLFFRYNGLLPNVPWSILWYRDGELLGGGTRLWETEQPSGERHEFLEFGGGFPVGEYEVQVWLGDQLQIRASFSVVGAQG